MCEILGSKGGMSEKQITLHREIEFGCSFSKIITGHGITIQDRLKSMLILAW